MLKKYIYIYIYIYINLLTKCIYTYTFSFCQGAQLAAPPQQVPFAEDYRMRSATMREFQIQGSFDNNVLEGPPGDLITSDEDEGDAL